MANRGAYSSGSWAAMSLNFDPERPQGTAPTVWWRINATSPYFQVRYATGVHLVQGETDRERYHAVDAGWAAMASIAMAYSTPDR